MKKYRYPLSAASVIVVDQLTKYLVRSGMEPGDRIPLIGDWLSIYFVKNTGTAFSMFSGNQFVTIGVTSILIIFCIYFAHKEHQSQHAASALLLSLIAAGGISNMIDRLFLGYVTDMISCGSFAIFNVADIFVTCGCFIAMYVFLVTYKDEDKPADAADSAAGSEE